MMDSDAVEALLHAVRREPTVHVDTGGLQPYALVPQGYDIKSLDHLRTTLDRVKQKVALLTADAFMAYWKRFSTRQSVIFADERFATYTAILDYHKADGAPAGPGPDWCGHVAIFQVQPSLEWEVWTGSNGKVMQQPDFARFMEDNYVDIVKPAHADMLAIASNLRAKRSVDFAEATELQNGETQLQYQEKIRASADTRQGSIKIPDSFELMIPPLLGSDRTKVIAKFRYRIEDQRLKLWYDLHRPTQVRNAAIQQTTQKIIAALKDAPFFLGSAG